MAPGTCTEPEIAEAVDLCLPNGLLNPDAVGWSRAPLHRCNLPTDARRWGRAKRWDYWAVTCDPWIVSVTTAHLDYLSMADVWFRDLDTGRTVGWTAGAPLGLGLHMPDRVGGGDIRFEQFGGSLAIAEENLGTRLRFRAPPRHRPGFEVDLLVESPPGHETLSVVIPWSDRLFQYTSKHNTRPAVGTVQIGVDTYDFGGEGAEAWGCLDFGRGRWPYRSVWNWGAASGRNDDSRVIGLQLGGKWTAGTGMTENALCVDGRLHKISEELTWEYGTDDPLRPWTMTTPVSDRVDLRFEPMWDKAAALNLGLLATKVDACFGHYLGTIVTDDGERIDIGRLFGWAEDCRWKW